MTLTYNLICADGHETTGDYPSIEAFEKARVGGFLECALCIFAYGEGKSKPTIQALSAPAVNRGVSRDKSRREPTIYDDVGARLFDTAVRIADGEEPFRPLEGRATGLEAAILRDVGFEIVQTPPSPKYNA